MHSSLRPLALDSIRSHPCAQVPCVLLVVAVLTWRWVLRHIVDTIAAVFLYKTRPKRESTLVNLFADESSTVQREG